MRSHGLASTYRMDGCRCDDCRAAQNSDLRAYRAKRKGTPPPQAKHGTWGTYTTYHCRCDPCVAVYREGWLRRTFGMTVADYETLLEKQAGVCAICRAECPVHGRLSVDHDHATGRVRGLLCSNCNMAIGLLKDDPSRMRAAAAYLEEP